MTDDFKLPIELQMQFIAMIKAAAKDAKERRTHVVFGLVYDGTGFHIGAVARADFKSEEAMWSGLWQGIASRMLRGLTPPKGPVQ